MRRAVVAGLAAGAAALGPRTADAQLVQGRVVTAAARKPLAGVPVRLLRVSPIDTAALPADTAPVARHRTAKDGVFAFVAPDTGVYRARIGDAFFGPVMHLASADTVAAAEYRLSEDAVQALLELEVEKPVRVVGHFRARFPEVLRTRCTQGKVVVQFVVDTAGRAEMGTLRVLRSSHVLFTQSVRDAVLAAEFIPAELGGRRVRQRVEQPVTFAFADGAADPTPCAPASPFDAPRSGARSRSWPPPPLPPG